MLLRWRKSYAILNTKTRIGGCGWGTEQLKNCLISTFMFGNLESAGINLRHDLCRDLGGLAKRRHSLIDVQLFEPPAFLES